jgi:hypothetical protein
LKASQYKNEFPEPNLPGFKNLAGFEVKLIFLKNSISTVFEEYQKRAKKENPASPIPSLLKCSFLYLGNAITKDD